MVWRLPCLLYYAALESGTTDSGRLRGWEVVLVVSPRLGSQLSINLALDSQRRTLDSYTHATQPAQDIDWSVSLHIGWRKDIG